MADGINWAMRNAAPFSIPTVPYEEPGIPPRDPYTTKGYAPLLAPMTPPDTRGPLQAAIDAAPMRAPAPAPAAAPAAGLSGYLSGMFGATPAAAKPAAPTPPASIDNMAGRVPAQGMTDYAAYQRQPGAVTVTYGNNGRSEVYAPNGSGRMAMVAQTPHQAMAATAADAIARFRQGYTPPDAQAAESYVNSLPPAYRQYAMASYQGFHGRTPAEMAQARYMDMAERARMAGGQMTPQAKALMDHYANVYSMGTFLNRTIAGQMPNQGAGLVDPYAASYDYGR